MNYVTAKMYKQTDGCLKLIAIAQKPTKAKTKSGIRKALKNWRNLWAFHHVGCTQIDMSIESTIL